MEMEIKEMQVDPYKATSAVYHVDNAHDRSKTVYWIKFYFPEYELYIADCTLRRSIRFPDSGPWFQPPTYFVNGKRTRPIEYKKTSKFGQLLKRLAIEAVEQWEHEHPP